MAWYVPNSALSILYHCFPLVGRLPFGVEIFTVYYTTATLNVQNKHIYCCNILMSKNYNTKCIRNEYLSCSAVCMIPKCMLFWTVTYQYDWRVAFVPFLLLNKPLEVTLMCLNWNWQFVDRKFLFLAMFYQMCKFSCWHSLQFLINTIFVVEGNSLHSTYQLKSCSKESLKER